MKVLMFGWEFPPHISGGLGTACYGLTKSLGKENIDILFVVPKLHGGESSERITFISAAKISLSAGQQSQPPVTANSIAPVTRNELENFFKSQGKFQTIGVESTLSPYNLNVHAPPDQYGLQDWNYMLRVREPDPDRSRLTSIEKAPGREVTKGTFAFTGTYGSNLMEEVHRYAQVASAIAAEADFDVIHAHDWMTFFAGLAAKRVSGKPLVVHVHATEYDRSGKNVNPQIFAIEKQGMIGADCVVTVSEWTRGIAISRYGIDADKVRVVHNGIFRKKPKPFSSNRPPVGSRIVTFLGRVTHQKGPLYFVEAARLVKRAMPDVHFVVAGAGDMLPLMIERIAQLRLSNCFHFTGFLKGEDVDRIWSMSSAYVMPSVSEPFGIAPLEAIQAGVPVIISRQSGVAEVMPHVIKVDFWNVAQLSDSICAVLKYRSLSTTLAQNSTRELNNITWKKAAKKLTKLYYGLVTQQHIA